jgi:hypothetical protein
MQEPGDEPGFLLFTNSMFHSNELLLARICNPRLPYFADLQLSIENSSAKG